MRVISQSRLTVGACACAVVEVVLRSDPLVTYLGIGAVVLGCLSLLRPPEPLPTCCLMLLMTEYAVAIHPFPSDQQLWSVFVVSVLLYIIHNGLARDAEGVPTNLKENTWTVRLQVQP